MFSQRWPDVSLQTTGTNPVNLTNLSILNGNHVTIVTTQTNTVNFSYFQIHYVIERAEDPQKWAFFHQVFVFENNDVVFEPRHTLPIKLPHASGKLQLPNP